MYLYVKTITIRDDVYSRLVGMKDEGESFSDVIEKLLNKKNINIKKYFGFLKDSEVLNEIEKYLDTRKKARFRI